MDTANYTGKGHGHDSEHNTQRKRVLCVEDDEDTGYMMQILLSEYGYEPVIAKSLDNALELSKRGGFVLYILDNWLKEGSGVELCEKIRAFDKNTPILFYTGAGYEADIQKGLACGAQAYLVKPDIQLLQETINRLVSSATMNA